MYTFMSLGEIEALLARHQKAPAEREAQETLASQVTELVHGAGAAAAASAATEALYGETPFEELSKEAREAALAQAPSVTSPQKSLKEGYALVDALLPLASQAQRARHGASLRGKGRDALGPHHY
jgi:tyrosyl-tRNA synthetase